MVMKMNKKEFIVELSKEINYFIDKCIIINDILESNFFISKKNRDSIIEEISIKLNISYEDAVNIYDKAVGIINNEIKNKLKHPFKSRD